MKNKTRLIKISKGCKITTTIMLILDCIACLTFSVLAIVFPLNNVISTLTTAEVAIIFAVLALYSFLFIDFFWNARKIFTTIESTGTPFTTITIRCLKKLAFSIMVISVLPAVVGLVLMHLLEPTSEIIFRVQIVGLISGLVMLLLGIVFGYAKNLKDIEDETI